MLAPWIISNFPKHRVYVEPYGGAASVLIQKPRSYGEVYNDLDGEMVNLFRVMRDSGEILKNQLALTPFARDEYKQSFALSDDPIEQARRTVVRSFMGFGSNALCRDIKSGFRSNSNRSGTTPAHDWANYPECVDALIDRLRGVVIENKPAIEIMRQHDSEETLHYCDPPYVHSTRSVAMHGNYGYSHEMTDADHEAFAECIHQLRGMVVISGYQCPLYDRILGDLERIEKPALADGARERTELLWFNKKAWSELHSADLFSLATRPQVR